MGEFALIDEIRRRCALARPDVVLGIGDDAALLRVAADQELAVSMDTLVAGVHFPLQTEPFDIGWKALAVNLSDLAAMGAAPAWATLALTLPQADRDWVAAFCDGFAALARPHALALVGGDTTQGPLSITVTVHGFVPAGRALRRDGAQPGDAVLVSGFPGDAAAGLTCVLASALLRATAEAERAELLQRVNRPTPRVDLGLALRGLATAAIDVSDGLVQDLGHIAARSGVAARVEAEQLPCSPALAAVGDAAQRRQWQLFGGDDYELCFTAPPAALPAVHAAAAAAGVPVRVIGRIEAGSGVRVCDADGAEVSLQRGGWEHFA
ncbi:thiamine-phosphate kinase [Tahibacter harae]|uniref:Thiamine-monophosphate kinase n=1 Tax=Tahibacter harae TaxID=2963937 RepID=A0ABT1QPZ7_9GAMM|nr:thiamine-phosphate kinase [Tahibacter harae]MCQ4164366.1 thiamine-phosphate kinase [Tahibacter harae]